MKIGKLGLLAPLTLICFLPGTLAHPEPKEPRAALWQTPLTAPEFTFTITGRKQGPFKGDGHGPQIGGLSYELQITSPRDTEMGLPTGKRTYKPFVITKKWGASSPQILTALVTNEILPAVQLNFTTGGHGAQVVDHVITLTNASIVDVHHHPVVGLKDGASDKHQVEDVSFTFQKITVEDIPSKTTFSDNPNGPGA